MFVYGCLCVSMCVYVCLCLFMGVYVCLCVSMCVYGCLWVSMGVYMCLWVSMCVNKSLWVSMGVNKFLWVPIESTLIYWNIFQYLQSTMYPLVLAGHEKPITILRFNYDGDLLFSGAAEKKINLWEAYTGERLGSYTTKSSVRSLDVDIDSKYLIACSNDGSFEVFDVKTGNRIRIIKFDCKLRHLQFNCNSSKFILLMDQFNNTNPSRIKVIDFSQILGLTTNYSTSQQSCEQLNIKQQEQQAKDKKAQQASELDQKKDQQKKEVKDKKAQQASELDQKKNQQKKEVKDKKEKIPLVLHSFPAYLDKQIRQVTRTLWYVDDQTIFASTTEGEVIHYNTKGEVIQSNVIHKQIKINSIAFSKDFSILATAANDGCKIVDPETLEVLREFRQQFAMNAVAVSPLFCSTVNPKFHLVMGGGISAIDTATSGGAGFEAHVCNIMYGREVGKISGHFGPINSIEFFRDGRGFASGGEEGNIRIVRFHQPYFEENNAQFQ